MALFYSNVVQEKVALDCTTYYLSLQHFINSPTLCILFIFFSLFNHRARQKKAPKRWKSSEMTTITLITMPRTTTMVMTTSAAGTMARLLSNDMGGTVLAKYVLSRVCCY